MKERWKEALAQIVPGSGALGVYQGCWMRPPALHLNIWVQPSGPLKLLVWIICPTGNSADKSVTKTHFLSGVQ